MSQDKTNTIETFRDGKKVVITQDESCTVESQRGGNRVVITDSSGDYIDAIVMDKALGDRPAPSALIRVGSFTGIPCDIGNLCYLDMVLESVGGCDALIDVLLRARKDIARVTDKANPASGELTQKTHDLEKPNDHKTIEGEIERSGERSS